MSAFMLVGHNSLYIQQCYTKNCNYNDNDCNYHNDNNDARCVTGISHLHKGKHWLGNQNSVDNKV